jgi:hypothetical protein
MFNKFLNVSSGVYCRATWKSGKKSSGIVVYRTRLTPQALWECRSQMYFIYFLIISMIIKMHLSYLTIGIGEKLLPRRQAKLTLSFLWQWRRKHGQTCNQWTEGWLPKHCYEQTSTCVCNQLKIIIIKKKLICFRFQTYIGLFLACGSDFHHNSTRASSSPACYTCSQLPAIAMLTCRSWPFYRI